METTVNKFQETISTEVFSETALKLFVFNRATPLQSNYNIYKHSNLRRLPPSIIGQVDYYM